MIEMKHTMNRILAGAAMALFLAPAASLAQPGAGQPGGPVMIGTVEYKKLETREATERRMLELLRPGRPRWGEWYRLTPFAYHNTKGPRLAEAGPPEAELGKMAAGGPGPD